MKKVLLIAAVAGLSLVSCKKDYTCKCVDSDGEVLSTGTTKSKKSDAETWCNNSNSSVKVIDPDAKCTLQ